jgi:hypothetical protein
VAHHLTAEWPTAPLETVCGFMPIYPLLRNSVFDPEQCRVLGIAFERCLTQLGLVDRSNPLTVLIANKIIELGQRGVRDPDRLCELTAKELGISPASE